MRKRNWNSYHSKFKLADFESLPVIVKEKTLALKHKWVYYKGFDEKNESLSKF
jgi:hypothetical protein